MNIADQGKVKGGRKQECKPILITQNLAMTDLYHEIKLVAYTRATVLPHFNFYSSWSSESSGKTIRA